MLIRGTGFIEAVEGVVADNGYGNFTKAQPYNVYSRD